MLETLAVFPVLQLASVLFLPLIRPPQPKDLFQLRLLLHDSLLVDTANHLRFVLRNNNVGHQTVQQGSFIKVPEVEQHLHQVLYLLFIRLLELSFLLDQLNQVVFLVRTAFFDLPLFPHFCHCAVLPLRFLAGL